MPEPDQDLMTIIISNRLANAAAKTTISLSELITNMRTMGMSNSSIREFLIGDLVSGGPVFGSYRNMIKSTVANGVNYASNKATFDTFKKEGVEKFRWVTVGDNVCPDCRTREGEIGTLFELADIGLPQSGFSICQANCKCKLVPESYTEEQGPISTNKDKPKTTKPPVKRNSTVFDSYRKAYTASADWLKDYRKKIGYYYTNGRLSLDRFKDRFPDIDTTYFSRIVDMVTTVKSYVGGGYMDINNMLRGDWSGDDATRSRVSELKDWLTMMPNLEARTYRTIAFNEYEDTVGSMKDGKELSQFLQDNVGNVWSNKAFFSTSNNANLDFAMKSVRYNDLDIRFIVDGKSGTALNGLNTLDKDGIDEDEVLFAPDTRWRIKSVKPLYPDGLYFGGELRTDRFIDGEKHYTDLHKNYSIEVVLEEI